MHVGLQCDHIVYVRINHSSVGDNVELFVFLIKGNRIKGLVHQLYLQSLWNIVLGSRAAGHECEDVYNVHVLCGEQLFIRGALQMFCFDNIIRSFAENYDSRNSSMHQEVLTFATEGRSMEALEVIY